MKKINATLVFLISSLTITGVSFIDGKLWDIVFIAVGMIAYAIVGVLFSIGVLHGKQAGRDAYAFVFFLLILGVYAVYKFLVNLRIWILGWPLFVKIIVICVIAVLIVTIVILSILYKKGKICKKSV